MSLAGPILILEDDIEDQDLIREAFQEFNAENELKFFLSAVPALEYLLKTRDQPFLIMTDMNLPAINGLEFKKRIQENDYLRRKSIPFIFFTTTNQEAVIIKAYDQQVQGFFQKPADFKLLVETLKTIVDYWKRSLHPNSQFD